MESNWTINLLVGDGDVTFYNKFPLVYIASTQERYQLNQNDGGIEGQEPSILWHASDNAAPIPARITEANKTGRWVLSIFDDENDTPEWDIILNNVHAINRHMSGADSTAARNTVDGTAQKVRVAIKPQGATNTTYYDVQSGFADVSKSYYTKASQQTTSQPAQRGAWFIPINFVFTDAGYGDSFTLRNDLPSSPHMLEDSNSDGLADGWVSYGAGVTTTIIEPNRFITGGKSQAVATDTTNDAGVSIDFPLTGSTNCIAYAWVQWVTNTDSINVEIHEVISTGRLIAGKTITFANPMAVADKSYIDATGNTWYLVSLSGGVSAPATTGQLRVFRAAASATVATVFLVDNAYAQDNATVIPPAFCSSSSLKNRYDPTSASAATRQQINYLDVWGIPGDLPALVRTSVYLDYASVDDQFLTIGRLSGRNLGAEPIAIAEAELFILGAFGTNIADSGRSGGNYRRYSTSTPPTTVSSAWANATDQRLSGGIWRVFAVGKTNNLDAKIKLTFSVETTNISTNAVGFTGTGTWESVDLGLLNLVGIVSQENITNIFGEIYAITVSSDTSSTVEIDYIMFLPVDEFIIVDGRAASPSSPTIVIAGDVQQSWSTQYYSNVMYMGKLWECLPSELNRYIYFISEENNEHVLSREFVISLEVTPRTSHLLGTA